VSIPNSEANICFFRELTFSFLPATPQVMEVKRKLVRAAGIYTLGILVSRILGVGREIAIANFLGTGTVADAFFVAFRLPNLWRRLFAEGTLSIVFVPVFTEQLLKTKAEAIRLTRIVITILGSILLGLSLLGVIFAPWLVKLIAPGFSKITFKFLLTVNLTRIMFPYVFFICLTALFIAILNSLGYFAAPAFCYAFLNISMIASLLIAYALKLSAVYCLAIGVIVGGILQLSLQLPFLLKEGISLKPLFQTHPALKRIFILMGPAVIGATVYQLSIFINTILASFLPEGSISYLYYADRIVQFPLALFAFSFGTASLPTLSAQVVKNDYQSFKNTFCFSLQTVFFFILPASIALIILGDTVISVLLQRGAFSHASTQATFQALIFYAFGLPFFSALRLLTTAFYAFQDTKTPVKISLICLILNIIIGFILMHPLKHAGLALATSIVSAINVFLLIYFLKKKVRQLFMTTFWQALIKTTIASLVMGLVLWQLKSFMIKSWLVLISGIPTGIVTFFLLASMLGCSEMNIIKEKVCKREK